MMIVETAYGMVKGVEEDGVKVFRGIPYASPPVGELRFMPPAAPEPWDDVIDCSKFRYACPQNRALGGFVNPKEEQNEDCLYLNVWTPGIDDKKRAVVVWIHGGAFQNGSGSTSCRGAAFADKDIVCVTVNYRLGVLGFLQLDEYLGERYRQSGNCGILDVVAALKWVQENIAQFGGDPNKVTVMGESAGAKLVGGLLVMKSAQGLFQKAILQSGASQAIRDITTAHRIAERIISDFGLTKKTAQELLTMPVERIVEIADKMITGLKTVHMFGPVFDGINFTKDDALEVIAAGEAVYVPLLIGTNREEALFFLKAGLKTLTAEKAGIFFGENAEAVVRAHQYIVGQAADNDKKYAHVAILTDYLYRIAMIQMVRQYLQYDPQLPVFMYRFDWDKSPLRASHGTELPFVWRTPMEDILEDLDWHAEIRPLAEIINAAWATFIKTGNPEIAQLPAWPRFRLDNRKIMALDVISKVIELPEPYIDEGFRHQVYILS